MAKKTKVKPIKNLRELAKALCAVEGKRHQVNIADMGEILGHISDRIYQEYEFCRSVATVNVLGKNGFRRAKKVQK